MLVPVLFRTNEYKMPFHFVPFQSFFRRMLFHLNCVNKYGSSVCCGIL